MRVGKGNDDNLDATIAGEAELRLPDASSDSAIPGKDMFFRFLSHGISHAAVEELCVFHQVLRFSTFSLLHTRIVDGGTDR